MMATKSKSLLSYYNILLILTVTVSTPSGATDEDKKVYIVYMGSLPEGEYSPLSHHLSVLQEVIEGGSAVDSLVRSYNRSFNGFAARLSSEEREKIASMKEVVSVFPSRTLQLQTTRSWDFMGFPENVHQNPTVESDVIVGVIDTGIWPESESFNDEGFSPAPMKWRGTCAGGKNFTCNNKIIGARSYFLDKNISARDDEGHGSHTASTAAGNKVPGASFYGLAEGNARGGVPSARIAAYKTCNDSSCDDDKILKAFDDAIADGVDIITISIGGAPSEFIHDSIAIGAFHAMDKGILTVQSAGNEGPQPSSVSSVAPWILSVAASSTDRRIIDKVVLGNGTTLVGNSVNSFTLNGKNSPLIYGKDVTRICDVDEARVCEYGCLDSGLVKGKIVLCNQFTGANEASRAGALGAIMLNSDFEDVSFVVPLPASALSIHGINVVESYINSSKNSNNIPRANILKSESINDTDAPKVASFSSRGPNSIAPEILKPDISAPGVDILAAYSPVVPPSFSPKDKRSVNYTLLSGTSMSCPHVAGAAAYVKTFHPDWSPSAIKSALMTTAWPMNATKNKDGEFAYGAGHINPAKAAHPGLVYEAFKDDYVTLLCSMGYNSSMIKIIAGPTGACPHDHQEVTGSPKDLNYPSMAVGVQQDKPFAVNFTRTVTNVGLAKSTYISEVATGSLNIYVGVNPSILSFKSLNEKQSFVVTVVGGGLPANSMESAWLVWSDGTHNVRSPIVVFSPSSGT